jgi:O-antigen/teichoic acid export membrane protein
MTDVGLKKIFQNTGWLVGGQAVAKAVGFVYFVYLARRLPLADFGWYTLALAYAAMLFPLIEFGLDRVILRDGARRPEKLEGLVRETVTGRVILSGLAASFVLILARLLRYPPLAAALLVLTAVGFFPRALSSSVEAAFQAREKMWVSAAAAALTSVLSPLIGLALLWSGRGVLGVMGGVVAAQVGRAFFGLTLARREGWLAGFRGIHWRRFRPLVRQSLPFAVLGVLSLLTFRVDVVILSKLVASPELGLYNAAYKLVEFGVLLPSMVTVALFPSFSRLVLRDRDRLKMMYFKVTVVLGLLGVGGALAVTGFSRPLLSILFGPAFLPAASVLVILSWALVLIFLNAPAAPVIQSSAYLEKYLPAAAALLVVNVGLNLWLIPVMGIQGAAWATLGTEAVGLVVNNVFVFRLARSAAGSREP